MPYDNLIGNEKVKQTLENIKTPAHAYLFIGKEGIGKKLFAMEFAKTWLCLDENRPCNKCKSCIQWDGENNPDFQIIEAEDNSIKIEQIRAIVNKVLEKPIVSQKKIYIINDADKMTVQAQNCLLKVLEEPPKYVIIILIGVNENQILNTIKSRCITIKFDKIPDDEIIKYLQEQHSFEHIPENMLEIYDGSIGKALEIKGQEQKYQTIKDIIDSIQTITELELLNKINILYDDKTEMQNILEYINVLLYKKGINNVKYLNCINNVNNMIQKLKINCNIEMNIDDLFIDIWKEVNK